MWVVLLAVSVALGVVAGRTVLGPAAAPDGVDAARVETYTVTSGTLGRSATYTAIATWGKLPFGTTAANGTLTSFEIVSGETVDSGSQLFAVDLRPVIALSGAVPSFRDLTLDSEGADVSQLQTFLRESGYLRVSADGSSVRSPSPPSRSGRSIWVSKPTASCAQAM